MSEKTLQIFSFILILAGLVLSILSWTDLCSFGGCTVAHEYRFFGLSLQLIGTSFFSALAILLYASYRWRGCRLLFYLVLAGGAGAEPVMILIQKNVIEAWCPLCLGIAFIVYLLCILMICIALRESRRLSTMERRQFIYKAILLLVAAAAGFIVSNAGISRPEAAELVTSLGKQNGKVEVFVFSDWLCPVCVKVEPAIEAVFPQLEKKAKVHFIDKPVHKESMNFVPYHLSFLVHEKGKYLQIRKALFDLAKINRNPSLEDIKGAVAPLGVNYKQLSFMDVSQKMAKAQELAARYKVTGTPTIVVLNSGSGKSKTLVGGKEINGENIMKAVKAME